MEHGDHSEGINQSAESTFTAALATIAGACSHHLYLIGSSVHRLAKRGSLMDRNPVPPHPSKSSAESIQLAIGGGSSALAAGDHHTQISALSLLY